MAQQFPIAPGTPRGVGVVATAIVLVTIAIAIRTTLTSLAWIGRVFPGFVLLDNRVIASVGLPGWSGAATPELFQSEILAVDGRPVASRADDSGRVAASRRARRCATRWPGAAASSARSAVPTQRFGVDDWCSSSARFC